MHGENTSSILVGVTSARQDGGYARLMWIARISDAIRIGMDDAAILAFGLPESAVQSGARSMIRAGLPTAIAPAGTSLSTTALAPMIAPSPIRTAPSTTAPAPI